MRPRVYFLFRIILMAALAVVTFALAMLVLSFVFFSIHESGEQFLLGFGYRGFLAFAALFPWGLLAVTIVLILLLDYVLRYFKFGYRVPMLRIFLIVLAGVVVAGIGINITPFHSSLLTTADSDRLPLIGSWYEQIHDSHQSQGVYRGVVSSIQGNTIVITHSDNDHDTDEGSWTILIPPGLDASMLHAGEHVYVAGTLVQGVVTAYGIAPFTPEGEMK